MTDRFSVCLPFILAQECPDPANWPDPKNFSDDAHDPGGKTMCGLTQREYDQWRKHQGLMTRDVRKITEVEGRSIYRDVYWTPYCIKLAAGLDLQFFDSAVNEGTTEALKILQFVLGVIVDGDWGPATAMALTTAQKNVSATVSAFTARRAVVYRETKGFQYFGKDWERRSAEIGATALTMIA